MKIKVCGMREPENIRQVADLHPDYMGFIFYPFSKRYVGNINEKVLNSISSGIKKTGVFVDSDELFSIIDRYKLDAVQLHGDESAALCRELKDKGLEVIKAVGVDEDFDFKALEPYLEAVDYFLFDTKVPGYGGSGKLFDWKLLEQYPYTASYFLSGGLGQDNLPEIKRMTDKRLYAVDLNSRFETEPGIKDVEKIEAAIKIIMS
jgi:phosphoribosylanthranilate isomerase